MSSSSPASSSSKPLPPCNRQPANLRTCERANPELPHTPTHFNTPRWVFPTALLGLYALLALEVFLLGAGRRTHGDSDSYLRLADSLAHGRGMVEQMPDGSLLPTLIRP